MERKSLPSLLQLAKAWLPPVAWALFIYLLSDQGVIPSFSEVWHDFIFKKSAHMFVYAVLYFLFHRAVALTLTKNSAEAPSNLSSRVFIFALILTFLYASSDELHQMFVPGRYGTIRDVGYDMLGAGIVLLRQYQYI